MIGQFVKRPESKHKSNIRPITGRASQQNQIQSTQCFEMGKKHMLQKQYEEALKHYTNATIHNPANHKAYCNMGTIYKENGKLAEARACYHKALFANPNDHISLYNLANLERVTGNYEIAVALYRKVVGLKENNGVDIGSLYLDACVNQGICLKNLGYFDEAIVANDKAIRLFPDDESGHFNKAMCIIKKIYSILRTNFPSVKNKLCKDCLPILKKVLQINPKNITAKVSLIQINYLQDPNQQKYQISIEELEKLNKSIKDMNQIQLQLDLNLKIKYCRNQLRKIDQAKIVLQPSKDIVEGGRGRDQQKTQRVKTANKYDRETAKNLQKTEKQQQKPKQQKKDLQNKQEKDKKQQANSSQSQTQKIQSLLAQKNFSQAFQLTKSLPDSIQKYQLQITINYQQCITEQNEIYLESAIGIYNEYILKNNEQAPITPETCSIKGHQIMATMLTVYGNYQQASKHYQVLLGLIGGKARDQGKLREIHVELGVCYAERGLVQEAIKEYKVSLQMQPDNYFLMTNLCGLLIQDKKSSQAKKYYEDYLNKNGWEKMENKVNYVDSLLNISICLRDTAEEWAALERTAQAVEKFFPNMDAIRQNLHEQAILGLYLRQIELLELKSQQVKPATPQRRQINEKLLQTNLTCLNFANCPDRQAFYVNTGILFYLSGCYANSYNFYKSVTLNKKAIANNIALSLLQMCQFQRGSNWLLLAIQQSPTNIIYPTNLQIVKWICGMQDRKPLTNLNYECRCETMYETRAQIGLHLINQLTVVIDEGNVEIVLAEGADMGNQVGKLFGRMLERCEGGGKGRAMLEGLRRHVKEVHGGPVGNNKIIGEDVLSLVLSKPASSQEYEKNLLKLLEYLKKLPATCPQYLITQNLLLLQYLICCQSPQPILPTLKKTLQSQTLPPLPPKSLQTSSYKQQNLPQYSHRIQIQYPSTQLKFETFQAALREVQCNIENQVQYLVEAIEKLYYADGKNILGPLVKEYLYPHCERATRCVKCYISWRGICGAVFGDGIAKFGDGIGKGKDWSLSKEIQNFQQNLVQCIEHQLQSQTNNIYNSKTSTLTLTPTEKWYPILLKTHHNSFQSVEQFLTKMDKTFTVPPPMTPMPQKGVYTIELNRSLLIEMFWGHITVLDRFSHWLCKRSGNLGIDGVLLVEDLADILGLLQGGRDQSLTRIQELLRG